jgi:AraC-like DNA-binding protein
MLQVVHRAFEDPRDYVQGIRLAGASEIVMSEPGSFSATLTMLTLGRVWLQRGHENLARTMHVQLTTERRSLAFLEDWQAPPYIQSGLEFGADDTVSFGRNSSHFERTRGPIVWATMSLSPADLEEAIKAIAGTDGGDPSTTMRMKPSRMNLTSLRQLHQEVHRLAGSVEKTLEHPEVLRSLEHSLTVGMVACLSGGIDQNRHYGRLRHYKIMLRFKEWLDANSNRAVYLQEVCTALNVSAPTLRRCSEEHLGMSPMHYLWLRRMSLARRELQRHDALTTVTATAMNFGFWHLGRFATEYHALFRETPSQTLARSHSRLDPAQITGNSFKRA